MTDIGKPDAAFDLWFDALPDNGEAPYMLAWRAYLHAREEAADMTDDLVKRLAEVIREADIYDTFEATARACLSAIEAAGLVIVPKDRL